MENYNFLIGKKISVIIWNADDENHVRAFLGEIIRDNTEYKFINKEKNWNIPLSLDNLETIKEVHPDIKEILLGADYSISLTLGNLADDSSEGLFKTGITWE